MKGLIKGSDLSNNEYHGNGTHYSSSQLKDALDDPEIFYKKYISGELTAKKKEIPAFAQGTAFHTSILEPDKINEDFIVWQGKSRRGKDWDRFKEEHKGKAIITLKEMEDVQMMVDATQASPVAMDLLSEGEPELSLFVELMGVPVKVRFDWINLENGYIIDLKSSSGNVKNEYGIRGKVSSFQYDLSAALYMDAVNEWIKQAKLPYPKVKRFYWIFASKDTGNCQTYQASDKNLEVGRAKYRKALQLIKQHSDNGWKFEDDIKFLEPNPWEVVDWLDRKTESPKQPKHKKVEKVREVNELDIL